MAFSSRSFDYSSDRLIPCVVLDGPPTEKTDGAIGVLCIDKESGNLYVCISANYCDRVFTWRIVGEVSEDQIRQSVSDYLSQNPMNGGLSDAEKDMLLTLFRGAVYQSEMAEETAAAYSYLQNLWGDSDDPDTTPDVSMTGISVVYSGGDVAVGTAVADLTGIVVTAHYSDGTSKAVTGYTLSGTIAEGANAVTVSYGGKTATFAVTGVAESGGETEGEVVSMCAEVVHGDMSKTGHYSDGGSTKFSDARFPTTNGKSAVSEMVFEKDTKLRITLAPTGSVFQCMLFCSTLMDADSVLGSDEDDLFYWCESSKAGFNYGWSAEENTWEYTVKAGYKFGVIGISSSTLPTKVEVI